MSTLSHTEIFKVRHEITDYIVEGSDLLALAVLPCHWNSLADGLDSRKHGAPCSDHSGKQLVQLFIVARGDPLLFVGMSSVVGQLKDLSSEVLHHSS